jgi:DNA-binding transcriptional LysR family regulator
VDLHHLRAFAAIAESRSFSRAARQLHISQPPLSRHIRQLEDELGVKLFDRSTSGVELTREGRVLLEKARSVLAEAAGLVELATLARTGVGSVLKVGLARGLWEVVNRIRVRLTAHHPEASIEGTDMASSKQYDALRERVIDVGVLRHVADDPVVDSEPLFEERFVVVVSDQSPLARRKTVRIRQLAHEPLLLHERDWAALSYDKILALYAAAGVTPKVVTSREVPGDQAAMLAVASGKGISLALRSPVSRSYLPVKGIAAIPLDEPDAELQVQIAWRKGETSQMVRHFVDAARETFGPRELAPRARRA